MITEKTKKDERPIWWLASYPKSGNTWIRAFLSSYLHGAEDLNDLRGVTGDNHPYFHQAISHRPIGELGIWDFVVLHNMAILHMCSVMKMGDPFVLKTHNANLSIAGTSIVPQPITKGAVYVVRDPRDVAVSYADHFGCSLDDAIEGLGRPGNRITQDNGMLHVISSWSEHIRSWMDQKTFRVGLVRYEDLFHDPAEKFRGLLEFFGVEPIDDARMQRALAFCRFETLHELEAKSGFRERSRKAKQQFFRRGKVGGWQDVLTDVQVRRIETDHGHMMRELGYELAVAEAA